MDKNNAIVADRILVDREVVAEDVSCELPGLSMQTVDVPALGTMSVPVPGLFEDMQFTITKIGVDRGYSKMATLKKKDIEVRFVQDKIDSTGEVKPVGCKAFLRVIPKEIPGPSVEIGSSVEAQYTYTVTRYQLFANGEELIFVDRLNCLCRVNGEDQLGKMKNLL